MLGKIPKSWSCDFLIDHVFLLSQNSFEFLYFHNFKNYLNVVHYKFTTLGTFQIVTVNNRYAQGDRQFSVGKSPVSKLEIH